MTARASDSSQTTENLRSLVASSRRLILKHQAKTGAFPAAPTYAVYQYSWLRDGAFIAEGLSRQDEVRAADEFHGWCARTIADRATSIEGIVARLQRGEEVPRAEFLPARFTVEGHDGTDEWWDFQTDGYGTWLWALRQHLLRHGGDPEPYRAAVSLTANYLQHVWSQPCYDWWEEHPDRQHVATLGALDAGFTAALELGLLDPPIAAGVTEQQAALRRLLDGPGRTQGRLVKWPGSTAVDGSLLALVAPFCVLDEATAARTLSAVEADLLNSGGVYRYLQDTFYGGGRWPVLTGFLGMALAAAGRRDEARAALDWIASTATAAGDLPEQVSDLLLHPDRHAEWVQRWGPVASPLLWSHGMFLMLAAELGIRS
jgi:GH15 family glucan-1,4-alpha-glucosidase